MRSNLDDNKAYGLVLSPGLKSNVSRQAIAGAFTVTAAMGPVIVLDPTGAQNITLPTKGSRFILFIVHGGTNAVALTLKDSTGATIGTVAQGKMSLVIDDGTATAAGAMS